LHDLFITIEGMSPAEYKHGGASLEINYSFAKTPFGCMIVASTTKGICMMAFHDDQTRAFQELTTTFPKATFTKTIDPIQQNALSIFRYRDNILPNIKLHLKGTEFQLKVWNSLLKIPKGQLSTYGTIAHEIGHPKVARAVGTAIGSNPIAYLIPCHRVIQSSGSLSNYRWGTIRKTAMIGWEGVQTYEMR
jgi:AraC family transcriptional regulator of adaptative response/methylated-DNA-[protein]-cysteine methyltransferase